MTRVAVVYHSAGGRTRALAERVAVGARSVAGTEVDVLSVEEADLHLVSSADAIVLGCPTYMGSASAAFKAFMDGTSAIWALQGWRDKLAGAFTHSAALSGDKLGTLTQLAVFAAQHGMVWVGLGLPPTYASGDESTSDTNRLGSHLGAMAQSRPGGAMAESDLQTAELLGRRIAEAARRWGKAPARPIVMERHPAAQSWAFPPPNRAALPAGVQRTNLRELVARPERFEHHLLVCASIGSAQLEITAASEPLYFAHINLSDELVVALPTGDDLVDKFPLRTFLARPEDAVDVGRYNHKNGDAVLHPEGWLHWPGRLRPPYAPFDFPPGMRRTGLSVVFCASVPTPGRDHVTEAPAGRGEDVKAYGGAAPPMSISDLRAPGRIATIGAAHIDLVVKPREIAPPRGGFAIVLEGDDPAFACDLYRIEAGARLNGAGIARALVFSSNAGSPDPVPASWTAVPPPPFATFEDGPAGTLPFLRDGLRVEAAGAAVRVSVGPATAEVPRYWLARMLYRLALHGLRLGWVETYGGFFADDRAPEAVRFGLRASTEAAEVPRAEALRFVEDLYRAVAPAGYVERLR